MSFAITQINKNLGSNILNLFFNVVLGIFYTPYLVHSLGIVAYGIVPLALIINHYINVFTHSLTSSLTRFYSISLQNKLFQDANKYLNTSLIVITAIILIISPFLFLLVQNLENVFTIPYFQLRDARLLFTFSIIGFILSMYSSVLNITLYAFNRLDLINATKIIRIILKFLLVIAFFKLKEVNIFYIGYSNFIAEVIVLIFSYYLFVTRSPSEIKINLKLYNRITLTSVLGMTIWLLIHQIGDVGIYRIDNFLVNIYFTTRESGILGALSEFGNYVILITSVISSLFGPLILIAYSKNDHGRVSALTLNNSLLVGVITSILTGVLIGFAKPLLYYWLGNEFVAYSHWFAIKLLVIPTYSAAGIFAFAYRAWNKIKIPALITILIGVVNFGSNYYILQANRTEAGINIALIVSAFLIIIQSYALNSYWFSRIYPNTLRKILANTIKIVIVFAVSIGFSYVVNILIVKTFITLLISMAICTVVLSMIIYSFILNKNQKSVLTNLVPKLGK